MIGLASSPSQNVILCFVLVKLPSVAFLLLIAVSSGQESLADRAAAARKGSSGTVTNEGRVVNGDYHNDVLGFTIKRLEGWRAVSRGQMNVNEAFGREALGLKGGISGSARVYGMHDAQGSSLTVAILQLPANVTLAQGYAAMRQNLAASFPDPKFSKEPIMLSAPGRSFEGFRVEYDVRGVHIVQCRQGVVVGDQVVDITVTAQSHEKLSAVLRELKQNLVWHAPKP